MRKQFYRPEIDGLRAIAVLPVVLYHADVPLVSGGFVGVDIFFVLSGFLITQIITRHIDEKNFSIAAFYERRIRRIAPALFVVLLATAALSSWLLLPRDLEAFSKSLISTVLFYSNMLFWSETGYFAAPAEFKPLLHTWSLAVEEQFYVLYPVFLILTCRYWRRALVPLVWLGLASSFLLSIWATANAPGAAFYLAPTRAWELLLGAVVSLGAIPAVKGKILREILAVLGLSLIAWSVFQFTVTTPFPGLAALAPCLGTVLVIHANTGARGRLGTLLSLKPIVGIGLISYSLYLWHWPLIVLAKYYLIRNLLPGEMIAVIALSFLLAFVSWKWIEQPFRKPNGLMDSRRLFQTAGASALLLICLALALRLDDGLSGRFFASELELLNQASTRAPERLACLDLTPSRARAGELCIVGAKTDAPPSFVLWGDSHADALMAGLDEQARKAGAWGYFAYYISCPPLLGIMNAWKPPSHECRAFNDAMAQTIEDLQVKNVVLAAMWSAYPTGRIQTAGSTARDQRSSRDAFETGLSRTLDALAAREHRVWIVEQVPQGRHDVPKALAVRRRFGIDLGDIEPAYADHAAQQAIVRDALDRIAARNQVHRLDPATRLCDDRSCRVTADGQSLYFDDDHLSEAGARWISPLFAPLFADDTPADE